MKTVRRLLHGEITTAIAFVAVGFLALFMFFDLVDELQTVARHAAQGYQLQQALLYIALKIPEHLYQLLPLSVLIGCIFVMARLAQSSEYTILRTGGLDPLRALGTLLRLGLIFVGLTFVIGDYVAPWADRQAIQVKAIYQGHLTLGQTGAWLKETQNGRHFLDQRRGGDRSALGRHVPTEGQEFFHDRRAALPAFLDHRHHLLVRRIAEAVTQQTRGDQPRPRDAAAAESGGVQQHDSRSARHRVSPRRFVSGG